MRTTSIIDPPVRNGGSASSRAYLPYSTPRPSGPEHLVPGEGQEVSAERGDVDRVVRHRLRAVDEHQGARLVRQPGDLGDRRDDAGDIRLAERHATTWSASVISEGSDVDPPVGQ